MNKLVRDMGDLTGPEEDRTSEAQAGPLLKV
jgi:hypothetical protein